MADTSVDEPPSEKRSVPGRDVPLLHVYVRRFLARW
jgi:hypothetical protein